MGEGEIEREEEEDYDDDDDWDWDDGFGKLTRCSASGGGSNQQVSDERSCTSLRCLLMSSFLKGLFVVLELSK